MVGENVAAKRKTRKQDRHYFFWTTYAVLLLLAIVFGGVVGMIFGYVIDLPRVEELQKIRPNLVSYLFSHDGQVVDQFALEKRILVSYQQIPDRVKKAILAAEDANFFRHPGIDFRRLVTTAVLDVLRGELKGASTLTMQISKMRFTSTEKTFERKIKDILYAIDIEKNYSKERIFTFYANQISMGHGRYGIASASDFYFHKSLDELSLAEAAMLAGVIPLPGRNSPINHPERALWRRNWVLGRMLEEGFVTEHEYREALKEPLKVIGKDDFQSPAPYFVEWVRQDLASKYQTDQIWQGGLRIHTTLDHRMQIAARDALREGLRTFDRQRRGWAGPVANVREEVQSLDDYRHPDWGRLFYKGQMIHGLVLESDADSARLKFGSYQATITPEEIKWTKKKKVDQVLKQGDLAVFTLKEVDRDQRIVEVALDQIPEVQGALLAIENRTGAIKAMVGGFDFELSKFNRAMQALRQPGSIFKPFTYVAAMEEGFSPHDQVLDQPVEFEDALGRPYAPSNWDDEFKGLITIGQALAESRNVPTVRLAHALGPDKIADVARRFGLGDFPPYLSIALGSVEVTLIDTISAFTCFANHGVRAQPYFLDRVEDHHGVVLEEHHPQIHGEVLTPEVADKMLYMLQNVVLRGSGARARKLGRPVGGKTGTTNESTDTWFVGFTPQITAGVWVGHDEKKSMGKRVYGANLALPIWLAFMEEAVAELPIEQFDCSYQPQDRLPARIVESLEGEQIEPADSGEPAPQTEQFFEVEDIAPPSN
jgi:penicillin-binding protein 1A